MKTITLHFSAFTLSTEFVNAGIYSGTYEERNDENGSVFFTCKSLRSALNELSEYASDNHLLCVKVTDIQIGNVKRKVSIEVQ